MFITRFFSIAFFGGESKHHWTAGATIKRDKKRSKHLKWSKQLQLVSLALAYFSFSYVILSMFVRTLFATSFALATSKLWKHTHYLFSSHSHLPRIMNWVIIYVIYFRFFLDRFSLITAQCLCVGRIFFLLFNSLVQAVCSHRIHIFLVGVGVVVVLIISLSGGSLLNYCTLRWWFHTMLSHEPMMSFFRMRCQRNQMDEITRACRLPRSLCVVFAIHSVTFSIL